MPPQPHPVAILTDIEGTTTPIAFVRETLFPYARARLPGFLSDHAQRPDVAAAVAAASRLAPGRNVLDALSDWMAADAKVTPLKTLQGLIWQEGYARGELLGRLYPDVPDALRTWHRSGVVLAIYSSGSEAAQRLLFSHSDAGDLASLFSHFFDTRMGPKQSAASYRKIADAMAVPPAGILFLSDMATELDAARAAGLAVCQLVRSADDTVASGLHPTASHFKAVQTRPG